MPYYGGWNLGRLISKDVRDDSLRDILHENMSNKCQTLAGRRVILGIHVMGSEQVV